MTFTRLAFWELRTFRPRAWCALATLLLAWSVVARVQEPEAYRRARLDFYETAMASALLFVAVLVPLAWLLARRAGAGRWVVRHDRAALRPVLGAWLALLSLATTALLLGIMAWFSVDRIFAARAPVPSWGLVAFLARLVLVVSPLAALAPALDFSLPERADVRLMAWGGAVFASLLLGVPSSIPSLSAPRTADVILACPQGSTVAAAGAATAAGLCLSAAAGLRGSRPGSS